MARSRVPPPMVDMGRFTGGPLIINKIGTGRFDGYLHRICATPDRSVVPTVATEIIPTLNLGDDARYDDAQDYFMGGFDRTGVAAENGYVGIKVTSGRGIVDKIIVSNINGAAIEVFFGWFFTADPVVAQAQKTNPTPGGNLQLAAVSIVAETQVGNGLAVTNAGMLVLPTGVSLVVPGPWVLIPDMQAGGNVYLTVFNGTVNSRLIVAFQGRFDSGYRRSQTS